MFAPHADACSPPTRPDILTQQNDKNTMYTPGLCDQSPNLPRFQTVLSFVSDVVVQAFQGLLKDTNEVPDLFFTFKSLLTSLSFVVDN